MPKKVQLLDSRRCPLRLWVSFFFGFEASRDWCINYQHQISRYLLIPLLSILTMIQTVPQASISQVIFIIEKQGLMYFWNRRSWIGTCWPEAPYQPVNVALSPQTTVSKFKHNCTHCHAYSFATLFFRWRLHLMMKNILLLFFSRPLKQLNHSFPCRLINLHQMKELLLRSEIVLSSRRLNSNPFIRKSKNGSNELSVIFANITDNSVVQFEERR